MMEKELYDMLQKEDKIILSLISAAKFKQKVIVQNDFGGLERVNANESTLLSNLDKISRSQQKLVSRLFEINSLKENGKPRILSILVNEYKELFNPDKLKKINELRLKVRNRVKELTGLNHQNRFLIEHASSLVKETISLLLKSRKTSLIDRKI
ncbi:MAG: flagellar protein FlgN [Melioribacteraceae bacterium]|nr:flagellar protein FlgN [Melioribacteraceae bacterium]